MKTLNALLLLILTTVTLNASEEIKYFENLGYTIAIPIPLRMETITTGADSVRDIICQATSIKSNSESSTAYVAYISFYTPDSSTKLVATSKKPT